MYRIYVVSMHYRHEIRETIKCSIVWIIRNAIGQLHHSLYSSHENGKSETIVGERHQKISGGLGDLKRWIVSRKGKYIHRKA